MGIYSDNARIKILTEQEKAERVKNSYCTGKFYGGAEIVVVAKNDSEAEKLEKLLIADFSRLKTYKEASVREHGVEYIEYDGNDFTLIKEGNDCGPECAEKQDAKKADDIAKRAKENDKGIIENFTDLLED